MNKPNVEAIIFDMDGTLIDSCEFVLTAMEFTLSKHGVPGVNRGAMAAVTGKPIHAMYEALAPHKDARLLESDHRAHHTDNEHLLSSYEGVVETLQTLKESGFKLGVFTGFDKTTYGRLRQFGLLDFFESIVEVSRYTRHKPDPEGLQLCMSELGVRPEHTVYVGDGVSDMGAGRAAGAVAVVGITHGFTAAKDLADAGADYLIDSLPELLAIVDRLDA